MLGGEPCDETYGGYAPLINLVPPFPDYHVPQFMIKSFSKITRTPLGEAAGAPLLQWANWKPKRTDCTGWHYAKDGFRLHIESSLLNVFVGWTDEFAVEHTVFYAHRDSEPILAADNENVDPETCYYVGGQVSLSWLPKHGPSSIGNLLTAFGFDRGLPSHLDLIPQENRTTQYRFTRKNDKTNVKLLIDKEYYKYWPILEMYYDPVTKIGELWLFFSQGMNVAKIPALTDFSLTLAERIELIPYEVAWQSIQHLRLKFLFENPPTEDYFLNYYPGASPLTTVLAELYPAWNHNYIYIPST